MTNINPQHKHLHLKLDPEGSFKTSGCPLTPTNYTLIILNTPPKRIKSYERAIISITNSAVLH